MKEARKEARRERREKGKRSGTEIKRRGLERVRKKGKSDRKTEMKKGRER